MLDIDADARILIASGYLQDDQISHLKSLGASGVIAKPYTAEKLSNTISTSIFVAQKLVELFQSIFGLLSLTSYRDDYVSLRDTWI